MSLGKRNPRERRNSLTSVPPGIRFKNGESENETGAYKAP